MTVGYDQPLYILPFDHRQSYVADLFHWHGPLTAEQHQQVVASKRVIYEGFLQAIEEGVPNEHAGILVDETFGEAILRDAGRRGLITALPTEKSGSDEFHFEYGDDFARHIEAFRPTFAKVLVRYNPEGDAALNGRQSERLARLSAYCRSARQLFMFELLVPATPPQLASVGGERALFDARVRPQLVEQTIGLLQDAGVEPDVWKIEGLEERADCERVVAAARRGGRDRVGCIVLGRGADANKVTHWLETAASVPGFIGFAVGRTSFWSAVVGWEDASLSEGEALSQIADRYCKWTTIFERSRSR